MSDEHYPEWQGVDWGREVESHLSHRRMEIDRKMGEYRALYPEHDDALGALMHLEKVIRDQNEEIDRLKAKNKRLKKILRRAIK